MPLELKRSNSCIYLVGMDLGTPSQNSSCNVRLVGGKGKKQTKHTTHIHIHLHKNDTIYVTF